MSRRRTFALVLLSTFIGLLLLGSFALKFFFPSERIKHIATTYFHQATGQHIAFNGDFSLSLLPLGIHITKIDMTGAHQHPLATINELQLNLALWPLLHKRIDFNTARIHGAHFSLDPLLVAATAAQAKAQLNQAQEHAKKITGSSKKSSFSYHFSIQNLDIEDAHFSYKNIRISDFTFKASHLAFNTPFGFHLHFVSSLKDQPTWANHVTIASENATLALPASGDTQQFNVTINPIHITKTLTYANHPPLVTDFISTLAFDMSTKNLSLEKIQGTVATVPYKGNIQIQLLPHTSPLVHGQLLFSSTNLNHALQQQGYPVPSGLPLDLHSLSLNIKSQSKKNHTRYLTHIKARMNQTSLLGDVTLQEGKRKQLSAHFNADQLPLADYPYLMKQLNLTGYQLTFNQLSIKAQINTPDWTTTSALKAKSQLDARIKKATLKGIDVQKTYTDFANSLNNLHQLHKILEAIHNVTHHQPNLKETTTAHDVHLSLVNQTSAGKILFNGIIAPNITLQSEGTINLQHPPYPLQLNALVYRFNTKKGTDSATGIRFPFNIKGSLLGPIKAQFNESYFITREAPRIIKKQVKSFVNDSLKKHGNSINDFLNAISQ